MGPGRGFGRIDVGSHGIKSFRCQEVLRIVSVVLRANHAVDDNRRMNVFKLPTQGDQKAHRIAVRVSSGSSG